MNRTISANVTEEQFQIIKKIAEQSNKSISEILKESLQILTVLYYVNEMLTKAGMGRTMETVERDSEILEHYEAIQSLMEPYIEETISSIPPEILRTIEEEGKELEKTINKYNKKAKLGRPPQPVFLPKENT